MKRQFSLLLIATSLTAFLWHSVARMQAQEEEPIAYMGHGAFFDQRGKEIEVNLKFVKDAQDWYRQKLLKGLNPQQIGIFNQFREGLKSIGVEGQSLYIVEQRVLDLLVAYLTGRPPSDRGNPLSDRTIGKLKGLTYALQWKLPNSPEARRFIRDEAFKLDLAIENKFNKKLLELILGNQKLRELILRNKNLRELIQGGFQLHSVNINNSERPPHSDTLRADLMAMDSNYHFDQIGGAISPLQSFRLASGNYRPGPGLSGSQASPGQAYLDRCIAEGVPTPPPIDLSGSLPRTIGTTSSTGWKYEGEIQKSDQFIVERPTEIWTYHSLPPNPEGVCIALPRYSNDPGENVKTDVRELGVICYGYKPNTNKACFWDNQKIPPIPRDNQLIRIGVPHDNNGQYLVGGDELGVSVCTDCHAGQNPFVIHPEVKIGTDPNDPSIPLTMGGVMKTLMPTSPASVTSARPPYIPLVKDTWPKNKPSTLPQSVPSECIGCHKNTGPGGAFPRLSSDSRSDSTVGYCLTILPKAIEKTMPQGGLLTEPNKSKVLKCFENLCKGLPCSP